MKFIELHLSMSKESYWVNAEKIMYFYRCDDKYTNVYFGEHYVVSVCETPEEIVKLSNN